MVFSVDLEASGAYEFAIASLRSETEDGTYSDIVVYTLECSGKWAVGSMEHVGWGDKTWTLLLL